MHAGWYVSCGFGPLTIAHANVWNGLVEHTVPPQSRDTKVRGEVSYRSLQLVCAAADQCSVVEVARIRSDAFCGRWWCGTRGSIAWPWRVFVCV